MGRRSISDEEIALIKAMLDRGMKNKDIQFFFNRPDRAVNSGRITGILSGEYSNSLQIKSASKEQLDEFFVNHRASETGVKIENASLPKQFCHNDFVSQLFEEDAVGVWRLRAGETDEHECKHEFDPKKLSQIIRAIAALSNNRGGYILIGVKNDMTCDGVGQPFHDTDVAHIMDKVKYFLSPSPIITTKSTAIVGDKQVGYIHVDQHPERPVIVYRDGDKLYEGEILFRYAGQSTRIKFGDLRAMLDDRDKRARMTLVSAAGRLADINPSNALVIDTNKNVLDAEGKKIFIDEKLVKTLNFIKDGEFVEKDGAATLRLIGEVSTIRAETIVHERISRKAIFQDDILQDFLKQVDVDDPMQYIIAAVGQPRNWQPIFYYGRKAKMTNDDIATALLKLKNLPEGKLKFILDRLTGERSAFSKQVSKIAKRVVSKIELGTVDLPKNVVEAICFSQAIISLPNKPLPMENLFKCLVECKVQIEQSGKMQDMGYVFKAVCRLDEMLYFKNTRQK
jgi:hypothetical protein